MLTDRLDRELDGDRLDPRDRLDDASPEAALLRELSPQADAGLSFAASGESPDRETEGAHLLERLLGELRRAASTQTELAGRVVASTRVGLGGSTITVCSPHASAPNLERHRASVERAMQARHARTRLVLSALTAASKIAAAAGAGSPIVALPAAWRFLTSVTSEWKRATGEP